MIAEIVSLSGDESQVAALLTGEERMAMEFFIACAPEDNQTIQSFRALAGFARLAGPAAGRARAVALE